MTQPFSCSFIMSDATAAAAPILNAPLAPIRWEKTLELCYADDAPDRPPVCFSCGKDEPSDRALLKCARCRVAGYCQKECQVNDWKKQHKQACPSYRRVCGGMTSEDDQRDARDEIFGRIRFYACPYAAIKQAELGRGFLFIQSDQTLVVQSLALPIDCRGRFVSMRSCTVHYLTLGEYDQEVCRDDFEMAAVRTELKEAVGAYDEEMEVVVLMRFRCGHVALGTATLVPDYKLCRQLGRDYFAESDAPALQLNLDDV